jgi:hypothetical protein
MPIGPTPPGAWRFFGWLFIVLSVVGLLTRDDTHKFTTPRSPWWYVIVLCFGVFLLWRARQEE